MRRLLVSLVVASIAGTGCTIGPLGSGGSSGRSSSSQKAAARSLERVVTYTSFARLEGRSIYLVGWSPGQAAKGAKARGGPHPDPFPGGEGEAGGRAGLRTAELHAANRLADYLVAIGVALVLRPEDADLWVRTRLRVYGGQTTHREWRVEGWPVYVHDEDVQVAEISFLAYEPLTGEVFDLTSHKTYGYAFEPYLLDVFGFQFEF